MRMMLKMTLPVEPANHAIKHGTFQTVLETTIAKLKPEATYFFAENGRRSAMIIFDMKDSSDIPAITEPFFMAIDADIELQPVMNLEDLQKGLAAADLG